jgi:hypothetical protein
MEKGLFRKTLNIIERIDFEVLFWLAAFFYLSVINPYQPKHLEFCLFSLVGIDNCPGCGLGKSISMIFHGDIIGSFQSHPLGIPALILIIRRIYQLIRITYNKINTNKMETING